jgi:hypothetical protein
MSEMGLVNQYMKTPIPNQTIVLRPRLKKFLERCMA